MQPLLATFSLLFASLGSALVITDDPTVALNKTFDYIVVDGGTAGLTVASRLTETPGVTVLVIEAGTDQQNNTAVNEPWTTLPNSVLDWKYTSTPQKIGGQIKTTNAGFVLGGSSSINGQEYARATQDQYDALEKLGNKGWNWDSMLSYMEKSERFHYPDPEQAKQGATFEAAVHGTHGPLSVSYPQPYAGSTAFQAYLSASRAVIEGILTSEDVSSGHPNGGNALYFTILPGNASEPGGNRRCNSAVAYVYTSLADGGKDDLTILVGHQGVGLVWETAAGR